MDHGMATLRVKGERDGTFNFIYISTKMAPWMGPDKIKWCVASILAPIWCSRHRTQG